MFAARDSFWLRLNNACMAPSARERRCGQGTDIRCLIVQRGECRLLPLDRAGFAGCLVGQCDRLEILDLRIVAVTRANAVPPGAGVEGLGVALRFPHVDAAGDAAFLVADELLAEEALGLQEIGRDFGEMRAAFLETNRWRQIVENDGGDHRRSWIGKIGLSGAAAGLPSRSSRTRPAFAPWASGGAP